MTVTPKGDVYPEIGTFPPPYRNSDNDVKEINEKLDKIIELLKNIHQYQKWQFEKDMFRK